MRVILAVLIFAWALVCTCVGTYSVIDGALQAVVRHYAGGTP